MKKISLTLFAFIVLLTGCKNHNNPQYQIGSVISLTGEIAIYGKDAQKGIELAVEQLNSKSNKKKFNVIYEDDNSQPQKAVNSLNKIILNNNIKVVIAPVGSSSFLSMCPIAEKNHILLFATGASNPKISSCGSYIFRNWVSDNYEGKEMAKYLFQHHKNRVAIFFVNNDYGRGLMDVFSEEFNELGGRIVIIESFSQGMTSFRTQLLKIKNNNVDAIYLVGYSKELGRILNQAKSISLNVPFFSSVTFENKDIINIAGKNAEGVIYSTTEIMHNKNDKNYNNFKKAFEEKFNSSPGVFATHAYDAMNIIAEAIKKVGYDPDKIKDYLFTLKNYPGVSGLTSFDKNGDVIKPVTFKTVKNGKFVFLSEN